MGCYKLEDYQEKELSRKDLRKRRAIETLSRDFDLGIVETNYYYYGARYYNPRMSVWLSVDPLAEKYPNASPYNYCLENPINFIDPDGRDIVVPNKADRAAVLKMINAKALGSFGFDKSGKLYQVKATGDSKKYSTYYRDRLVAAIKDKDVITISIGKTFLDDDKIKQSVDDIAGGGVTSSSSRVNAVTGEVVSKKSDVIISGNELKGLTDTTGAPLEDKPADILAHELVGHAIPHTVGKDTGNAVKNENKVRQEMEPGKNQKRAPEPDHTE